MWGGASVSEALDPVLSLKERKKKRKRSRQEVAHQIPDHDELTVYLRRRSIPRPSLAPVAWSRAAGGFCTGCPRTNLHNIASRCNYHRNSAEEQLLDIHQTVNVVGRPYICLISSLFFVFCFSPPRLTWPDEFDAYIIVSFVNATLVLSIGETVEEVTDSGFLGTTPTLSCSLLGDDALVQVMGSCFWHVCRRLPVAACCTVVLSAVVPVMSKGVDW